MLSPLHSLGVREPRGGELPGGPTFSHIPLEETCRAEDRQLRDPLHTMLTSKMGINIHALKPAGGAAGPQAGGQRFPAEYRRPDTARVVIFGLGQRLLAKQKRRDHTA